MQRRPHPTLVTSDPDFHVYAEHDFKIIKAQNNNLDDIEARLLAFSPFDDDLAHKHLYKIIEKIKQNNLNINCKDHDGKTALSKALCNKSDLKIIEALLDADADFDHNDFLLVIKNYGHSAISILERMEKIKNEIITPKSLMVAIENSDINIFNHLLAKVDVNVVFENKTPLMLAAYFGNFTMVGELLARCSKEAINYIDNHGRNALRVAMDGHIREHRKNYHEIVQALINAGIDCNVQDTTVNKYSPLHTAAANGLVKTTEMLIKAGANLDLQTAQNESALFLACDHLKEGYNFNDIASLLINNKANVDLQASYGSTALTKSVYNSHFPMVNALIKAKANVDLQNDRGLSALIIAVGKKDIDMVKLLLAAGANRNLQEEKGNTALHFAIKWRREDIALCILNNGTQDNFDLNLKDKDGNTPLMLAIEYGMFELVKSLLLAGADANIVNQKNQNALDKAVELGYYEMFRIIVPYVSSYHNASAIINLLNKNDANAAQQFKATLDSVLLSYHFGQNQRVSTLSMFAPRQDLRNDPMEYEPTSPQL